MKLLATFATLALCLAAQDTTPADEAGAGEEAGGITLDGTIVPADSSAVSLWLEEYRDELLILEAVEHGSFVNEGDVLVRFDTRKIDRQIRRAEFDLRQAEQSLRATEEEGRIADEAESASLTRAGKEAEWADRRLRGYQERERVFREEEIRLRKQSTEHGLEDQRDELEQLEKMYREDELVDATEEIVLKRSRRRLASSTAWAGLRDRQSDYALEHTEALKLESLELEAAQKRETHDRQGRSVAIKRARREAGLYRARFDLESSRMRLERLERDRELLTVRAPRSGLVLHGDAEATPGSATLERGARASLFKTIATVAGPDRFKIVSAVPESALGRVRSGIAARVSLAGVPDYESVGRLQVAYLPSSRDRDGVNMYRAEIALEGRDARLRPGMRCEIEIDAPETD